MTLRNRYRRPDRSEIRGSHHHIGGGVGKAQREDRLSVQEKVDHRRIALRATQAANQRKQKEARQKAGENRRRTNRQSRLTKEQPKRDHQPDRERWLIEVAPVEMSGAIPVIGLVARNGRQRRPDGMDQGQPDDEQKISALHYDESGPSCSGSRGASTVSPRLFFRALSSRSVSNTVETLTVVVPLSRGRCGTPT